MSRSLDLVMGNWLFGVYLVGWLSLTITIVYQHRTIRSQRAAIETLVRGMNGEGGLLEAQTDILVELSQQYQLLAHHCVGPAPDLRDDERLRRTLTINPN